MTTQCPSGSRRTFLKQAGIAAAAGLALPGCDVLLWPDIDAISKTLTGLLHRPDLAGRVGRRYLEERDAATPATVETLTRELMARADFDAVPPALMSVDRLYRAVRDRIREDFAEEKTVIVDGWLLSRTECLLCAIAHLRGRRDA